jgi:hypothetical protein
MILLLVAIVLTVFFPHNLHVEANTSAPLDDPVTDMISLVSESNINTTVQTLQEKDILSCFFSLNLLIT